MYRQCKEQDRGGMAGNFFMSILKIGAIVLFSLLLRFCILYHKIGREITASKNSFKDIRWTTEKQYTIALEQLDSVFFHITLKGDTDKEEEISIEMTREIEDNKYVIKLEKPRNEYQRYHYLYFSTIMTPDRFPPIKYIPPGQYTFRIVCNNHGEAVMKEGELFIGYFCKIKRLRYYKKKKIPFLQVREMSVQ